MPKTHDIVTNWLKDAHAMERAALDNLERQVKHYDDYPDVKMKLQEQIEVTKRHEQRIEQQLRAEGVDPSTMKDVVTRIAGQIQSLVAGAAPDEIVKQTTSTLAYENWEIANYRAIAAAAEYEGELSVRTMFQEMANEKIAGMNWLVDALPDITKRYVASHAQS